MASINASNSFASVCVITLLNLSSATVSSVWITKSILLVWNNFVDWLLHCHTKICFFVSLCVSLKLFLSWIFAICHMHLFIDLVVENWPLCELFFKFLRRRKKLVKKKKIWWEKASEREWNSLDWIWKH